MRQFSVVNLKEQKVKPSIKNITVHGKTPNSAARKAFSKIYRLNDIRRGVIHIKEDGTDKIFKYKASRKKVDKKVMHDGKEVVHKYQTTIKAIR